MSSVSVAVQSQRTHAHALAHDLINNSLTPKKSQQQDFSNENKNDNNSTSTVHHQTEFCLQTDQQSQEPDVILTPKHHSSSLDKQYDDDESDASDDESDILGEPYTPTRSYSNSTIIVDENQTNTVANIKPFSSNRAVLIDTTSTIHMQNIENATITIHDTNTTPSSRATSRCVTPLTHDCTASLVNVHHLTTSSSRASSPNITIASQTEKDTNSDISKEMPPPPASFSTRRHQRSHTSLITSSPSLTINTQQQVVPSSPSSARSSRASSTSSLLSLTIDSQYTSRLKSPKKSPSVRTTTSSPLHSSSSPHITAPLSSPIRKSLFSFPNSISHRTSLSTASPLPTPSPKYDHEICPRPVSLSVDAITTPTPHHHTNIESTFRIPPSPKRTPAHLRSKSLSSFSLSNMHACQSPSSSPKKSPSFKSPPASPLPLRSNSMSMLSLSSSSSSASLSFSSCMTDYSDRYIPSRSSSNLSHAYAVVSNTMPVTASIASSPTVYTPNSHTSSSSSSNSSSSSSSSSSSDTRDEAVSTYTALLRNEIIPNKDHTSFTHTKCTCTSSVHHAHTSISSSTCMLHHLHHARTFSFKSCPSPLPSTTSLDLHPSYQSSILSPSSLSLLSSPHKPTRSISSVPYKVLDAPSLSDDFYLNLVSWSSTNIVCVGLGSCVYLWSAANSRVTKLCEMNEGDSVTSVTWNEEGTLVCVGTKNGICEIYDIVSLKKLSSHLTHTTRIGVVAWSKNCIASGSRDRSIIVRDVRMRGGDDEQSNSSVLKLHAHSQEVCGLKWALDADVRTIASGGNDNKLYIWDVASTSRTHGDNHIQPMHRISAHTAAVKAIAWSPHQLGVLSSGGGTADRCIRFFNSISGIELSHIDTGSQVCNLVWSKNSNEIVSTHGYSLNQICVWKYPSMQQIACLTGHTYRVLYLSESPDGQHVVTGAGDETLRFWNIFQPKTKHQKSASNFTSPIQQDIR